MAPKISVCMPAYNAQRYIAEAIESILNQTARDFELIICDDCSNDDTLAIARAFKDERIRCFKNEQNLGAIKNFNRSISYAQGEYVYLFCADDIMKADNLEKKQSILDKNPNVGFVLSDCEIIDDSGNITGNTLLKEAGRGDFIYEGNGFFKEALDYERWILIPSAMLFRKECFLRLGLFETALPHHADREIGLRVALFYDIAYIDQPLFRFRCHPGSDSTRYSGADIMEERYKLIHLLFKKYNRRIQDIYTFKQFYLRYYLERSVWHGLNSFRKKRFREAFKFSALFLKLLFLYPDSLSQRAEQCLHLGRMIKRKLVRLLND